MARGCYNCYTLPQKFKFFFQLDSILPLFCNPELGIPVLKHRNCTQSRTGLKARLLSCSVPWNYLSNQVLELFWLSLHNSVHSDPGHSHIFELYQINLKETKLFTVIFLL